MILLIDNYDSFVFNLARYFRELGCEVDVVRNDDVSIAEIAARRPEAIVLSPGPCTPKEAGICLDVVRQLSAKIPMLGICLGHQTIAEALGGEVVRANEPVHGRTSLVQHDGRRLFADVPNPLKATRYHSLIVPESTLPSCLKVTARTADDIVMAFEHLDLPIFGLQFHPESVLTASGHQLLANFLREAGLPAQEATAIVALDEVEHRERRPAPNDDWNSIGPLPW